MIAGLDHQQQSVVVGRANLTLIERGMVQWSDVVTPSRVRDFREVVALKKLSIRSMVESGVNRSQAEKAYATVHTPHHEIALQHRKALVDNLIAKGIPKDQIGESFGKGMAGRVTVGKASGGSPPLTPTPTPPPVKPPAEISPVVAKMLGVISPPQPVGTTLPEIEERFGVTFAPSYHARNRDRVLIVDVEELESLLARDVGSHVGTKGSGLSAKPGAYAGFLAYLGKARREEIPIEMPRLTLLEGGLPGFTDGRHRFAVFRDLGARYLPVTVSRVNYKKIKALVGAVR